MFLVKRDSDGELYALKKVTSDGWFLIIDTGQADAAIRKGEAERTQRSQTARFSQVSILHLFSLSLVIQM